MWRWSHSHGQFGIVDHRIFYQSIVLNTHLGEYAKSTSHLTDGQSFHLELRSTMSTDNTSAEEVLKLAAKRSSV